MPGSVRCVSPFATGRRIVGIGDVLPDNDPIIKGREALFEKVADPVKGDDPKAKPAEPARKATAAKKVAAKK